MLLFFLKNDFKRYSRDGIGMQWKFCQNSEYDGFLRFINIVLQSCLILLTPTQNSGQYGFKSLIFVHAISFMNMLFG